MARHGPVWSRFAVELGEDTERTRKVRRAYGWGASRRFAGQQMGVREACLVRVGITGPGAGSGAPWGPRGRSASR